METLATTIPAPQAQAERVSVALASFAHHANEAHRATLVDARGALTNARLAGEWLAKARDVCPHGSWLAWLEESFEGSQRTAYNYLSIHKHWDELEANFDDTVGIRGALEYLKPAPELEKAVSPGSKLATVASLPNDETARYYGLVSQLLDELTEGKPTPSALRSLAALAQGVIQTGAIDDGTGEMKPWLELSPERKRAVLMASLEEQTFERWQRHKQRGKPSVDKTSIPTAQLGALRRLASYAPVAERSAYTQKWRDEL